MEGKLKFKRVKIQNCSSVSEAGNGKEGLEGEERKKQKQKIPVNTIVQNKREVHK